VPITWEIPERIKAAFMFYTATNMIGGKNAVRLSLRGRRGDPGPSSIRSMVIRAPIGTTVVFMTQPGPDWQQHTWRAVRLLEGQTVPGTKSPMPGARIPDLDALDPFDSKKTSSGYQESYPLVERFIDGVGWTFGRAGDEDLKGNVWGIRVLKAGLAIDAPKVRTKKAPARPKSPAMAPVESHPGPPLQAKSKEEPTKPAKPKRRKFKPLLPS